MTWLWGRSTSQPREKGNGDALYSLRNMSPVVDYVAQFHDVARATWCHYLTEHSGLPGPRANLTLVAAVADIADEEFIDELLTHGGEFQAMCAAAALGQRATLPSFTERARTLALDDRWRVREGVVLGLQALGSRAPTLMVEIVRDWIRDDNPLVQRAAIAAICEPRLLRSPQTIAAALEACQRTTQSILELSPQRRTDPDVRTLRQTLGYCWSVAIAADPSQGLDLFAALDVTNPDIAWIVKENRRKRRLSKLL